MSPDLCCTRAADAALQPLLDFLAHETAAATVTSSFALPAPPKTDLGARFAALRAKLGHSSKHARKAAATAAARRATEARSRLADTSPQWEDAPLQTVDLLGATSRAAGLPSGPVVLVSR